MTAFTPLELRPLPDRPLISVLMSSYNYARYVADAIASVVAQTWDNWELIVCDDGSTDASPAIIADWAAREPRVRLLQVANGGQAAAWNYAYAASRGEIVCFLDPDDRALPDKLARSAAAFRADNRVGATTHQLRVVNADGVPSGQLTPARLDSGWLAPRVLARAGWADWPPTSGIALRRELCARLFPAPTDLRLGHVDAYLMAGAAVLAPVCALPAPLGDYRIHGANQVAALAPVAATLEHNVRYYELTFQHVAALYSQLDNTSQQHIRLTDLPAWYWEQLLALYVLTGKRRDALRGHRLPDVLSRVVAPRRRRYWLAITKLPAPLAARALRAWWGQGRAKRALKRLS